ncbi:Dirigent domain-containing protein [Cephalotus follicularis]|uniref:Dirigent protein n=1 Tax=Cephalotus follicularis TaxID=3775 RepID=A0A1Q3CAA9_CEPFO|nr:Dirigent domain-containing protein [Cephalotus follicularis]
MVKALTYTSKTLKATVYLFLLAITLKCARSARIIGEVDPQQPVVPSTPQLSNPAPTTVTPITTLPSGVIPAVAPSSTEDDSANVEAPSADVEPPASDVAPVATVTSPVATVPTTVLPTGQGPVAATSATVANGGPQQGPVAPLSFFMHDIVGGSNPSSRTVTGIIAKTETNGIPFSKVNSNPFPVTGGAPLLTNNNLNNVINPNNLPFLTGLNGAQPNTIIQNTGNGNNIVNGGSNNQPFVTAGQLPSGDTLQKLMFGSITVIDDELTEGHELGSAVVGKAQGFYLASSLDGTSQTLALTVLLHDGDHEHEVEDTISLFGVHRTASPESQVAVVGGTGKYENCKGYATLETLHQEDQHTTDGVDTIVHFSVFLSQ